MKRRPLFLLVRLIIATLNASIITYALYFYKYIYMEAGYGNVQFVLFVFAELLITSLSVIFLPGVIKEFRKAKREDRDLVWYHVPSLSLCLAGIFPGVFALLQSLESFVFALLQNNLLSVIALTILYIIIFVFCAILLTITAFGIKRKQKMIRENL